MQEGQVFPLVDFSCRERLPTLLNTSAARGKISGTSKPTDFFIDLHGVSRAMWVR